MSADAGKVTAVRFRLPPEMWAYLEHEAKQRDTSSEEVMCRVLDAWFAAGRPDPGVPDVLATSGQLTVQEVNIWRALVWWLSQLGIPAQLQ